MTLQHVSLEIRQGDVPAELRFWALLGFEPVAAPGDLAARSTWVQSGARQIHLLYTETPVIPPQGHVAVVCPNYAETLAALSAAGVVIDERARHWGEPRCYVHSPSGHLVEVMAAPPPS
jgi:catechol 2,3-dioxygenase-like lactoylglutathione lyase family enzyme